MISPLAIPTVQSTSVLKFLLTSSLLSEIFASITGLEYAYTKAPPSMKSFVMSMFLLTSAFGSALSIALLSVSVNPKLVWMYTGISISAFIAGWVFWILFKRYNAQEDKMDAMEAKILKGLFKPMKSANIDEYSYWSRRGCPKRRKGSLKSF